MSILKPFLFSLHSTLFRKVIENSPDVCLPLHMWEEHKQDHKQVQVKIHFIHSPDVKIHPSPVPAPP